MNIPKEAVEAAVKALSEDGCGKLRSDAETVLESAAPFIAAQALRDAAWGFPLSTNHRVRDVAGKLHAIADELDPQ